MFGGTQYAVIELYHYSDEGGIELRFLRQHNTVCITEYVNTRRVDVDDDDIEWMTVAEADAKHAAFIEQGYTTEWVGSEEV